MSAPERETLARARGLMERVLRGGAGLASEYPLLFESGFPGRLVALEEHGDVRSACGILVRDFKIGGARVRTGLIGSVTTDPAWRRRGLASRLLARAEQLLLRDGCMLALLWADEPAFYRARGYQPLGHEVDFVLEQGDAARLPDVSGIRASAPDDLGAIHKLYSSHRERVERSREETKALLSGPRIETLVVQRERDVVAYSCFGRGTDLEHTVHEWAGAANDVLGLLRAHVQRATARGESSLAFLMTPPSASELHQRLAALSIEPTNGILGLGKLLDPEVAAALLAEVAGAGARVSVEDAPGRSSRAVRVSLRGPRGVEELAPAALQRLLFAPGGERGELARLEQRTGLALAALPLSIFAWGLDSI